MLNYYFLYVCMNFPYYYNTIYLIIIIIVTIKCGEGCCIC